MLEIIQRLRCVYSYSLLFIMLLLPGIAFAAKIDKISRDISLTGIKTVTLINPRGEISFKGTSVDNLVLKGTLDEQAQALKISRNGVELIIKVILPQHIGPKKGSNFQIILPSSMNIQVKGVDTKWKFNDTSALNIQVVGGEITATNVLGDVIVDAVSVNALIKNIHGNVKFNTLSGKIIISEISGKMVASAVDGSLTFKQKNINLVKLTSVGGTIDITGKMTPLSLVDISTVAGNVRLAMATSESLNYNIDVLKQGQINNQLNIPGNSYTDSNGVHLDLSIGDGLGKVNVTTVSGTVYLMQ